MSIPEELPGQPATEARVTGSPGTNSLKYDPTDT